MDRLFCMSIRLNQIDKWKEKTHIIKRFQINTQEWINWFKVANKSKVAKHSLEIPGWNIWQKKVNLEEAFKNIKILHTPEDWRSSGDQCSLKQCDGNVMIRKIWVSNCICFVGLVKRSIEMGRYGPYLKESQFWTKEGNPAAIGDFGVWKCPPRLTTNAWWVNQRWSSLQEVWTCLCHMERST